MKILRKDNLILIVFEKFDKGENRVAKVYSAL